MCQDSRAASTKQPTWDEGVKVQWARIQQGLKYCSNNKLWADVTAPPGQRLQ